jgi:type II secretory pathway pseudopilin PulG
MRRLCSEQGFTLIAAVLVLSVISILAMSLLVLTDTTQKAALREQASESAFHVAEAALNAQIGQLSRAWPAKESEAYPSRCTASTTTATNGCPSQGNITASYSNLGTTTCPAGTQSDKWGSAPSNEWTTYVRDDGEPPSALFNSTAEQSQPATWDKNGNEAMWVRAVGVVQCRMVVLITLVTRQQIALNFPKNAVTGNWFVTTNEGHVEKGEGCTKALVCTQGEESGQNGNVSMRCEAPHPEPCKNYKVGQISPDTSGAEPSPAETLNQTQLAALKQQAQAGGHYYPSGTCPVGLPVGAPVYVEGPCAVASANGNEVANSTSSPGFLVIVNGTFFAEKNTKFYGVVYCVNEQQSSEAVVKLHGNAQIIGAIVVDGNGGIEFGSSGTNFIYEPKAIVELKAYAGAAGTRNSFRILPNSE